MTVGFFVPQPASAQDPVISDISKNAYNVVKYLNRRAGAEVSATDAGKIKKAVMANTVVDDGEAQMLGFMKSGQGFTISLGTASAPDVSFDKPLTPEAKAVLETIVTVTYDDPVEAQWMRGNVDDLQALISLHNGSEQGKDKVLGLMIASLKKAHNQPDFDQSKKQTGLEFARWSSKLHKLDGSDYSQFKAILYEAAVIADKDGRTTTDGNILDFQYKHFGK